MTFIQNREEFYKKEKATCDQILFAVCLQGHATLRRRGGSVDGLDILVRTFEHLIEKKKQANIESHRGLKALHLD